MQMRRIPGLPEDSKIPYPLNQEIRSCQEVSNTKRRAINSTSKTCKVAATEDTSELFNQVHGLAMGPDGTIGDVGSSLAHAAGGDNLAAQAGGVIIKLSPEIRLAANKNMQQAIGDWAKKKRELLGVVAKSKQCENTKGCRFEQDLEASIEVGDKHHAMLQDKDIEIKASKVWEQSGVDQCKSIAEELFRLMKEPFGEEFLICFKNIRCVNLPFWEN